MKNCFLLVLVILISSCRTYLDDEKNACSDFRAFNLFKFENRNKLAYLSKIGSTADNEKYYPQHFEIDIPKKIKSWSASGDINFIEYDFNQIVMIDAGNINRNIKTVNWKIVEDKGRISNYANSLYQIKKRKFDIDKELKQNRQIKIFTDGKTYIVFYNFKKNTNSDFQEIVHSFKYID